MGTPIFAATAAKRCGAGAEIVEMQLDPGIAHACQPLHPAGVIVQPISAATAYITDRNARVADRMGAWEGESGFTSLRHHSAPACCVLTQNLTSAARLARSQWSAQAGGIAVSLRTRPPDVMLAP